VEPELQKLELFALMEPEPEPECIPDPKWNDKVKKSNNDMGTFWAKKAASNMKKARFYTKVYF
jgi:hypothetical protein